MLRNADETEVLIIILAETTPVYEAIRLESDLKRAGINSKWGIINPSLYATETTNKTLKAKASNEIEWINKVDKHSNGNFAVIEWIADEIKGERLLDLIG
jgi:arsenite-transporting ATPase